MYSYTLLVYIQNSTIPTEINLAISNRKFMCLPFYLGVPFLGIYSEDMPPRIKKYICNKVIHQRLFVTQNYWKVLNVQA